MRGDAALETSLREQFRYEDGRWLFRRNATHPPVVVSKAEMEAAIETYMRVYQRSIFMAVALILMLVIGLMVPVQVVGWLDTGMGVMLMTVSILIAMVPVVWWVTARARKAAYSDLERRPPVGPATPRLSVMRRTMGEQSWKEYLTILVLTLAYPLFLVWSNRNDDVYVRGFHVGLLVLMLAMFVPLTILKFIWWRDDRHD